MTDRRLVYSTDRGSVCPTCGWPKADCRCSSRLDEPVPPKVTAKLRLETKGRKGKEVTIVDGLPRNTAFLEELAKALKTSLGTGGSVSDGAVEIQGDHRERIAARLRGLGYTVNLAGG